MSIRIISVTGTLLSFLLALFLLSGVVVIALVVVVVGLVVVVVVLVVVVFDSVPIRSNYDIHRFSV